MYHISQIIFVILITGIVKSNPINQEGLTNLCMALSPLRNNDLSSMLTIASSLQTNNVQTSHDAQDLSNQLYNSVIVGDYETAVAKTLRLELEGKSQVIVNTVNKLIKDNKSNVVEFAYKLWNMFGKNIVKDYFPIQFRMLLNEDGVIFLNKRDDFPLTVVVNVDGDGNRIAYGDGNDKHISDRLRWSAKPIWEENQLYFKILNTLRKQYLKFGIATEGTAAEHIGYTAEAVSDNYRSQWYLKPVMYEESLLFYIINREYNQAMKLSSVVNSEGNRIVYSHNGNFEGNPDMLAWHIKPF